MFTATRKTVILPAMKPAWNAMKKFTRVFGKAPMVSKGTRDRRRVAMRDLSASRAMGPAQSTQKRVKAAILPI